MGDFLSEFSRQQVEFAKHYAIQIFLQIPKEVESTMGEGEFALLASNVERNAVLSMQGYAHWLACKLVDSKNFKKQPMPICDEKGFAWISGKYDVPVEFIKAFVLRISWWGAKFPLVGKRIRNQRGMFNMFVPDEAALKKYEPFRTLIGVT